MHKYVPPFGLRITWKTYLHSGSIFELILIEVIHGRVESHLTVVHAVRRFIKSTQIAGMRVIEGFLIYTGAQNGRIGQI